MCYLCDMPPHVRQLVQEDKMKQVMLHAYRDIDFLLQKGFDTNVEDCTMDGIKDTIKELKESMGEV